MQEWDHRDQFVKWVSYLHRVYRLKIDSFVLAIYIYDRIRNNPLFPSSKLMMLCCVMLAMKFEEIYPPSLYSLAQMFKMELILEAYIKL